MFAADFIARYLSQAHSENGETPRAAVLYRTNSQSRLFEEAMRRYQMNYHVVGGFSFYERAEIKDMISYLKVIHNPDDSIATAAGDQYAHARYRQEHDGDAGADCAGNRAVACGARSARPSSGSCFLGARWRR